MSVPLSENEPDAWVVAAPYAGDQTRYVAPLALAPSCVHSIVIAQLAATRRKNQSSSPAASERCQVIG